MEKIQSRTAALMASLALACSAGAAGPGTATPPGSPEASGGMHMHGGPDGHGWPVGMGGFGTEASRTQWSHYLDRLNLTPEQRQLIREIFDRYRDRGLELAQRGTAVREQLTRISPDDATYAGSVDAASQAAASLAADMVRLLSEVRVEVYGILSAEQRQQLRMQRDEERQRWDDWRERHKPSP